MIATPVVLAALAALAALTSACGHVDPGAGEEDVPADGGVTPDVPEPEPEAVDRNCVEVKARLASATDGPYWIDPDLEGPSYRPFRVFCAGMDTPGARGVRRDSTGRLWSAATAHARAEIHAVASG